MIERIYAFRAEFFDCDAMGVMWHGNYVKYCEMARCRLLDEAHCDYNAMRALNFALPVVKMDFKYIAPIFFNDEFSVKIKIDSCDVMLELSYIFMKDATKLCVAHTKQVAVMIEAAREAQNAAQNTHFMQNAAQTSFEIPQVLKDAILKLQ